jgi:L-lactate permease
MAAAAKQAAAIEKMAQAAQAAAIGAAMGKMVQAKEMAAAAKQAAAMEKMGQAIDQQVNDILRGEGGFACIPLL